MTEALAEAFSGGSLPPELKAGFSQDAQTVHRLLGWNSGGFRHHRDNPLPLDMLVVDEASMLDLELATSLMDALPDHASLVLLGDRHQLASVEAGAVLANLCREDTVNAFSPDFVADAAKTGTPKLPVKRNHTPLTDHVVELKKSWRFDAGSGIATLSALIRDGQAQEAGKLLEEGRTDLKMLPCTGQVDLAALLKPLLSKAFTGLGETTDPALAFKIFGTLRLLSPVRKGSRGFEALNRLAREALHGATGNDWYPGRPVMILENDYNLGLFNGDVGIALPTDGSLRVFFPATQGFTSFAPARLPRHETCYAITVHKSQGSEFGHTVLVLPEEPCPVLGRELLYTALTRAREQFTLIGTTRRFKEILERLVKRDSGLWTVLQKDDRYHQSHSCKDENSVLSAD
jgi:exodeoxyribonuclease V alpha subunit